MKQTTEESGVTSNAEPARDQWRSLAERAERVAAGEAPHGSAGATPGGSAGATPGAGLLEYAERARPGGLPAVTDPVDRRDFLHLLGASMALAGVSGCTRQPDEKIYPYARSPEQLVPGKPLFFATAMPWATGAVGLLVESHMGRPTKVEGNPDHPGSLGATDTFCQASVLSLYDPDRSHVVRHAGRIATWDDFVARLGPVLERQRTARGAGLRILTETVTSPTLARLLDQLVEDLPRARWHAYEPLNRDVARAGAQLAFGTDVSPHHDFGSARMVLSFDEDFLAGPGGVTATRQFSFGRRAREGREELNRLYVAESAFSITGAKADHRVALTPSRVASLAARVAALLGVATDPVTLPPEQERWAQAAADDLSDHRGAGLVLAGRTQPAEVHALCHAMNHTLGNVGTTVVYTEPIEHRPTNQGESLAELVREMDAGTVDLLLVLGGNPLYTAPADSGLRQALEKVPLRVHLGQSEDETSHACHWHLPEAHFLESWGDTRAADGGVSIVQPLIAPLYGGRTASELVALLLGRSGVKPYDLVRETWLPAGASDFESFWRRSLHAGLIPGTRLAPRSVSLRGARISPAPVAGVAGLELSFHPDAAVWDGRFANNAWLQECPRPLSKLTWDNAVCLAPATAASLGVETGDVVDLGLDGARLRAPVFVQPGQAEGCVSLTLGYGRRMGGKVLAGVGFDVASLRRSGAWTSAGVTLERAGEQHEFATTQEHHSMEGRDLVRVDRLEDLQGAPVGAAGEHGSSVEATLAEATAAAEGDHGAGPGDGHGGGHGGGHGDTSMYPEWKYDGHAWGMVIDLNACTGCNACVVSCQSENNIPVVGKAEVARGRELHWLRIDRYFDGPPASPLAHFQPVPCMHCENAPCEVVCPVGATTHSDEGLNEMTYNRCVGTRYCANNCPYKVRRFNFFHYADDQTESLKLQRNPDVTVRSRGVMEKCTYCVQRINQARIEAKKDGRPVQDGEIVTACQSVCAASAITFGDLNDPHSEVSKRRAQPHHYGLLEELNTKPRTTYLAKVENPTPRLESHGD